MRARPDFWLLPLNYHAKQRIRYSSQPDRSDETLKTFSKDEFLHEAIDMGATAISRDSIYYLLQQCIVKKDLNRTRRIQCLVISNGLEWVSVLTDHLIRAFASCSNLPASNQVFLKLSVVSSYAWNAIISAHVSLGDSDRALRLYCSMQQTDIVRPDKVTFLHTLQACSTVQAAEMGRTLHTDILFTGFESDIAIATSLVRMYAHCGALPEGRKIFDGITNRDIVLWGALLSGYAQHDYYNVVLELAERLQKEGIQPDRGMYMTLIKSCAKVGNIEWGQSIHMQLRESALHSDVDLGSAVICMYSALGSLKNAYDTFEQLVNRDVVTWGSMMSAYVQHGIFFAVLRLYENMEHDCIEPDQVIFALVIKACSRIDNFSLGRLFHAIVIIKNLDADMQVHNSLIELYMRFGRVDEANAVFEKSSKCNVSTFDVMIAGYVENGHADFALVKFCEMKAKGVNPSEVTFVSVLKACSKCLLRKEGRLIHDEIVQKKAFRSLRNKDVTTWDALILGALQSGDAVRSLDLFHRMKQDGTVADEITYLSVIKAVGSIEDLKEGHLLHDEIIRSRFERHSSVSNSIVDMYAKCGSLAEAHREFDMQKCKDVITWGALIAGYVHNGDGYKAFLLFEEMQQMGLSPDQATYVSILKACAHSRAIEAGRYIHSLIAESTYASDRIIGNALIDMYVKCGELSIAHQIFDSLTERDIVSWGSMICGFAKNGLGYVALDLYEQMQQESLQPTRVHHLAALQACAIIGAVEYGKSIYEQIRRSGLELDPTIANTLMNFYVRYGQLEQAVRIFEELPQRTLPSWNAIMYGYAASGDYKQVMKCLYLMLLEGLKPDNIVFATVLESCSNANLLEEAFQCIKSMKQDYYNALDIEHYNYLIDILLHAGMPKEASELTYTMPCTPDCIVWITLLKNCRIYGSEGLGCPYFGVAPTKSQDSLLVGSEKYIEMSDTLSKCTVPYLGTLSEDKEYILYDVHKNQQTLNNVFLSKVSNFRTIPNRTFLKERASSPFSNTL